MMSQTPYLDTRSPRVRKLLVFLEEQLMAYGAADPQHKEAALKIMRLLLGQMEVFYRGPTETLKPFTKGEKQSLLGLAQRARKLLAGINSLNFAARTEVTTSIPNLTPGPLTTGTSAFHALPGVLENFIAEIETVTSEPLKSGPKTSQQVREFVWMLTSIWQEATGDLPPRTRMGESVSEGKTPFALALSRLIKELDEGKTYSEDFTEATIVGLIEKYPEELSEFLEGNPESD